MEVVILTEGGKDYGYGHVARCSSIYQAFEHYNIFPKFVVNGDESIKSIVPDIDVEIDNWLNNSFKADIVVVDSYLADRIFYNEISKNSLLGVYLDDNNRFDYPKGIVVNGTLDSSACLRQCSLCEAMARRNFSMSLCLFLLLLIFLS